LHSRNFKATKLFEFVAQHIAIGNDPHIPSPLDAQIALGGDIAFGILHNSAFSKPARQEELLKGALGWPIPEFIARFGAGDAIRRVELELRRAGRAGTRKALCVLERRPGADRERPRKRVRFGSGAEEHGPFDRAMRPSSHEDASQ
jgi:hypothetical protein